MTSKLSDLQDVRDSLCGAGPDPVRVDRKTENSLALAALCLSALMLGLEISSIPSMLPTLERVLGADFR